jgi:HEAT repeat protein
MHTVQSELDDLLNRYEGTDVTAGKKVQELRASMDAKTYGVLLCQSIQQREPSDALRFAASLLPLRDLAQMLLELYVQSKEKAIGVAEKLAAADPRFDATLLECLREDSNGWSDDALLVGLDILDTVSERDRLVLNVLRLLKHDNPKLRSKAALFIARRRPYLRWVTDLSREPDARVRANTLESLFEIQEDFIAPLFRQHLTDDNNRVAGNAVLGLYRLGDTSAIQFLERMAKDERPNFRNTGAWVMGQTGDPRFSSTLAGQLSDPDKLVRRQALLGLGEIKKAFKMTRDRSPLDIRIIKHGVEKGREQLITTVASPSGQAVRGLPGTRFLLKAGAGFVREYKSQEFDCKVPVNVCLVECLPHKEEDAVSAGFEEALKMCLALRRAKDKLSSSQLTYDTQLRCYASDVAASATILTNALSDIDFAASNLQLIIVGATREKHIVERLVDFGSRSTATVHLIAVAPEWRTPELRHQISAGGGYTLDADPSEVSAVCFAMHSALLHHYRLDWQHTKGNLELEVRADSATGITTYYKGETPLKEELLPDDDLPENAVA